MKFQLKLGVRGYQVAYLLMFMIGSVLLVLLLYQNNWNLNILLSNPFIFGLFTVSGTTMRFLSGIGIMLTYASLCTFVFKRSSERIKRNKKMANTLKILLLLPLCGIGIYGVYKILSAFFYSVTLGFLESMISLYGVWSLVFSIYILPLGRNQYQPIYKTKTTEKVRKKLDGFRYSLWRGYQTKVKRDYGKAYTREFARYTLQLETIQLQLSGVLLLPLCLILLVFPPLALVFLILWIRSFNLEKNPLERYERGVVLLAMFSVIFLSTAIFLTINFSTSLFFLDTAYGIGILTGIIILTVIIIRS